MPAVPGTGLIHARDRLERCGASIQFFGPEHRRTDFVLMDAKLGVPEAPKLTRSGCPALPARGSLTTTEASMYVLAYGGAESHVAARNAVVLQCCNA